MSTWKELKDNPKLRKVFDDRTAIVRLIREFFWSKNFQETDTPIAVRLASQEPYLNPVTVKFADPVGKEYDFFLRTSPEYALKKILCAGYDKVFEMGKCFRNNESFGGNHNTEFTMLEWYRAPGILSEIMDDLEGLFKYVGEKLKISELKFKDLTISLNEKWERLSVKEVWQKYAGVNLDENLTLEKITETAHQKGYVISAEDVYEDIFFKIFLNEIEPKLGIECPTIVYDYPAQMCSLSILSEDTRYAERFECYVGGLEICNAFGELTDADEQNKRLEEDRALRAKLGKSTWPIDPDFIAALRSGLPAKKLIEESVGLPAVDFAKAGGIALGVDRMVLLFTGARDLDEVMFGSITDQLDTLGRDFPKQIK